MGVDGDIIAPMFQVQNQLYFQMENLKMGVKFQLGKNNNTNEATSLELDQLIVQRFFFFYDENENNIREVYNEMVLQNWDLNICQTLINCWQFPQHFYQTSIS